MPSNNEKLRIIKERRRASSSVTGKERRKDFKRASVLEKLVSGRHSPFMNQIEFRPARNSNEIFRAAALVYKQYILKRYVLPNADQIKVILHQITSSTGTFIATARGHVLATLTLVEDSPLGVPIDKGYKKELDHLRKKGHRIGEISLFAVNDEILAHPKSPLSKSDRLLILFRLFKSMIDFVRSKGKVDTLVAAFLTKHDFFYEMLHFVPLGDPQLHQVGPNQVAACARYLDLAKALQSCPDAYRRIFNFDTPPPPQSHYKKQFHLSLEEAYKLLKNIQG